MRHADKDKVCYNASEIFAIREEELRGGIVKDNRTIKTTQLHRHIEEGVLYYNA